MKKFTIVMVLVAMCVLMAGCASINISPMMAMGGPGGYVFHNKAQVAKNDLVSIQKTAEITSKVWLGIFGKETFPTVARVAKENGITKIASVEYIVTPGILGLWVDYTTSISGE